MASWFWACPDLAEENTGTKTGEDPGGVVEDAEFEAVEVLCIKELLLFGFNCCALWWHLKTSRQDSNDTQSALKEWQQKTYMWENRYNKSR